MPETSHDKLRDLVGEVVEEKLFGPMGWPRKLPDVEKAAYLIATFDSAQYFLDNMYLALSLPDRSRLLRFALEQAKVPGLIVEFGVFQGWSLRFFSQRVRQKVYGFDSFEGLPEDRSHFQRKGRFSQGGKLPENLPENAEVVKGWFDDTLPPFFAAHDGAIRLAHVDCDLYSSTKTVLAHIGPRLRPGSLILFDEYFNHPGWRHEEYKAFQELVAESGLEYEYIGFVSSRPSVLVRITKV